MKNYFGIAVPIAIGMVLVACNTNSNQSATTKDSTAQAAPVATTATISFKEPKLQDIYNDYIVLKDALVATKMPEAKTAAQQLASSLKAFSGCENTAVTAQKIENAKDIAAQRTAFTALSSDVIALFKHAELAKGTIFVQHCPMANKGDGGDWLSSEKKIQNPYYGSEMMECGSVTETIAAK